ncbi:MAG: universal stress protein [Flavobacteriales bacterium]
MNNILCPTDLSETAQKGVNYAAVMAKRFNGSITLLHVLEKQETKGDGPSRAKIALEGERAMVKDAPLNVHLREGEFMHEITEESRNGHALMVCATHGLRGLKQSLFGAHILKLVRKVEIPSMVVQKNSPDSNDFGTIVLPVAGHSGIDHLLNAVCLVAKHFGSMVHIYQLNRPGEEASEELLRNKKRMVDRLTTEGIPHKQVEEPSRSFSVGFSVPTIEYSKRVHAGCIAIMSVPSEEYRYIADAEKERLLTNDAGIPVLCAH